MDVLVNFNLTGPSRSCTARCHSRYFIYSPLADSAYM